MIINDDVSIGFTIISHRQSFSLTFLHLGVITTGSPKDLIFSRATARVYENDTILVKMPLIFVPFHQL